MYYIHINVGPQWLPLLFFLVCFSCLKSQILLACVTIASTEFVEVGLF